MHLSELVCELNFLVEQYLQVTRGTTNNRHINQASAKLNAFTKKSGFLEAAFLLMDEGGKERDRDLLMTSLIKDKFKYDYETI